MCKVDRQGIFSESVSPQPLFASCKQLILVRCQIIQAVPRFRSPLLSAEKFDVIKLSRLVNQVATASHACLVEVNVACVHAYWPQRQAGKGDMAWLRSLDGQTQAGYVPKSPSLAIT